MLLRATVTLPFQQYKYCIYIYGIGVNIILLFACTCRSETRRCCDSKRSAGRLTL